MIKKLLVVSIAALGIGLNGCLTDPEESTAPSITLQSIGTVTAGSGTAVTVTGKIEASDSITNVTYKIYTAAGVAVEPSKITVTGTPKNNKKSLDISVAIQAFAGAKTDDYNLKISATTDVTSEVNFPFHVQGSTTPISDLTTQTVSLGAHDNATVGSSIDLDAGTIMKSAAAKLANSGVDIVYTYSERVNSPVIMNPAYAKTSSGITAFETWVGPNATQFHKVPAGSFESTTTVAGVQALFDASLVGDGRITVEANDVLVIKTDKGAYILVKMNTVSSNATGTATIKYAK